MCFYSINNIFFCDRGCSFDSKKENDMKNFDIEEVRNLINEYNKSYGKRSEGDIVFFKDNYTNDAYSMPPGVEELKGIENIINYFKAGADSPKASVEVLLKDIIGGPEIVTEIGTYEIFDSASKSIDKGKFIALWKQEDGKWKIFREIWNTDVSHKNE